MIDDTEVTGVVEASPEPVKIEPTVPEAPIKVPSKRKPKAKQAAKPAKRKASANGKANGAHKAKKLKAKSAKPRQRDPAKLDEFGFRKGSIKSNAARMYASKKGATLSEVREKVGSVQFNMLAQLEERGFKISRTEEAGHGKRPATRYQLKSK